MHSLTSLPTEILANIVANLGPSQADHLNFDHQYKPDVSLYRLAQTCKTLLSLCIPKLYEICNLKATNCQLSLLRTLATKPDIASLVKRVIINDQLGTTEDISAEDAELFNGILEEKLDMTTITPLHELKNTDELQDDRDKVNAIGVALACAALASVSNVTSIIFSAHYSPLGHFKPGSFPVLDTISLQEAGTEGGADFASIEGVLNVAPNVTRFFGWAISDLPKVPYPSIKEVVLSYSCLVSDEVAQLPIAFPNLERFMYVYGGATIIECGTASAEKLSEALISLKKTLKHVELGTYDFGMDIFDEDFDDEDGNPFMKSLSQMEVLQTLRLPSLYICKIDGDDEDSESKISLVDFLPPSIQSVYIEQPQSYQLQDMLELAQVASQRFPALRRITFASLEESLVEIVQGAYNGSGIECSFQGEDIHQYECCCDS